MSWFERHLNWSWVMAFFASFLVAEIVGIVAWLIIPELPEDIVGGLIGIIRFVILFSASLWVLAMKGRKIWWVFLAGIWAPVWLNSLRQEEKGVVQTTDQVQEMNNTTEYDIGQQYLAYYQEELRFKAFQEEEADLYNEALVRYGMSVETDDRAAEGMLRATRRLVESANEILRRRAEMSSVPDMASAMYFAWQTTYSDYSAWASAQAAAVRAVAEGMVPHGQRVKGLLSESEKSRRKAEKEEKRFLKRLGLTGDEAYQMLVKASMAVADKSRKPQKVRRTSKRERPKEESGSDTSLKLELGEIQPMEMDANAKGKLAGLPPSGLLMRRSKEQLDAYMGLVYLNTAAISYHNAVRDDLYQIQETAAAESPDRLLALLQRKVESITYRMKHRDSNLIQNRELKEIEAQFSKTDKVCIDGCKRGIQFLEPRPSSGKSSLEAYKKTLARASQMLNQISRTLEYWRDIYKQRLGDYDPFNY